MTGFASVRGKLHERQLLLEAKSVNHRFCEVNIRLPGKYSAWEVPIQKIVRNKFHRGRIDIFLKEEGSAGLGREDRLQFKRAHQELKRLCRELNLSETIELESLLHFKQHFFREEERFDASSEWIDFKPLLDRVLESLERMRRQEGQQLFRWFRHNLPKMQGLMTQLKRHIRNQTKQQKKKIRQKIKELGFDKMEGNVRVAAEMVFLADKVDVTEEIVRMDTHLNTFREIINCGGAVGRKIDFLMQEIGREINTVASKSQDSAISNCAIQFKTEIEKIREQAGNVE